MSYGGIRPRCPICKAVLLRPDVRTCGARDCVKSWREMSADERQQVLRFNAEEQARELESASISESGAGKRPDAEMPAGLKEIVGTKEEP